MHARARTMLFIPVHWWHQIYSYLNTIGVTFFWKARFRQYCFPTPGFKSVLGVPIWEVVNAGGRLLGPESVGKTNSSTPWRRRIGLHASYSGGLSPDSSLPLPKTRYPLNSLTLLALGRYGAEHENRILTTVYDTVPSSPHPSIIALRDPRATPTVGYGHQP